MKKLTLILGILVSSVLVFGQSGQIRELHKVTDHVSIVVTNPRGKVTYRASADDLETNAGLDWQYNVMGNTAAQPAACNYLALTADTGTPAATDTTLTGEITTNGLTRSQGTPSHTAGVGSYAIAFTWTATGTQTVNRAALFNASSVGTMCFESPTFSSGAANLTNGSQLTVTYTISY